ncbi:hypothetical protein [Spirosoma flavum]|uniref:Tc1-like transposase DDE domain-containing protein n=1 Tax=Spirosoma flavum TaxID=2048557 RepID=A0ABW6AM85_9BACT
MDIVSADLPAQPTRRVAYFPWYSPSIKPLRFTQENWGFWPVHLGEVLTVCNIP